ncbi:hypothetical protein KY338_02480 [Candidatus Woesearchaeota archaeon]|nr:hypothetical protein [Candidatus Woesearchaeota archaeon]MBW3005917.1 hypothetical protein [Candidatus Woesearchaeota archaeon]
MSEDKTKEPYLQIKDFMPVYGIYSYLDRVPEEKRLSARDIINTYILVIGQSTISTAASIGIVTGLEAILKSI